MAKVVTDNKHYSDIATAIRALLNTNATYTPAQMAPAILGYIAGGIDLTDIESYFITDVINAMKYVKNLGTDDWVHHIVITDTHQTLNYGHSTAIVKAMQDTGYFSKLIHLGDMADNNNEGVFDACVENYGQFNGNMLFTIGNHDAVVTNWQTLFYDEFLSDDTDIVVSESDNYCFYWDDAVHRIRYICHRYGDTTYPINRIKDAPSGYSVITLCHYKDKITSDVLVPILGHGLNFIGNIVGHDHIDAHDIRYEGMFHQIRLNNDGKINDNANYVKTDGTNQSQAITIMSINTTTKNVKFYRIGIPTLLGQNWQYTYVQGGSVEGWLNGYYWGTGQAAVNANGYIALKRYPVFDGNNNEITYYYSFNSGTPYNTYTLILDTNGDWISPNRQSKAFGAIWNYKGGLVKSQVAPRVTGAGWYLISFVIANLVSTNDIVISTQRPNIGRTYSTTPWQEGAKLGSDGAQGTDEDAATTYAFDIQPSTTYRFYVDDADWTGTGYICAFTYGDIPADTNGMGFKMKRRLGKTSGTWKEITFTTNADEYYCRISVDGLLNVDNYGSKCHLEVVNS